MKDLSDMGLEYVEQVVMECTNKDGQLVNSITGNQRDLKSFIVLSEDGDYHIKSPKTFFGLLLDEYAPQKKKSFFKSYPNNEALASIFDSEYETSRINDRVMKTIKTHLNLDKVREGHKI